MELLSQLRFDVAKPTDAAEPTSGRDAFRMSYLADEGGGAFRAVPIASIVRPTREVFRAQLDLVEQYTDLRAERAGEVLAQVPSQYAFWSSVTNFHPDRHPRTNELIDVALRMARGVELRFKQALGCPRPAELSPQVQPMLLTPGHTTFPSGHSTEAHLIAFILERLIGPGSGWGPMLRDQLARQAGRIAVNRTVAGVHYPVDSAVGCLLGTVLGEFMLARCGANPKLKGLVFDGERYPGNEDFRPGVLRRLYDDDDLPEYAEVRASDAPVSMRSPLLSWLWERARAEFPQPA
ncbi:MAG: phosphatase PAP2 family protein [Burkholderiales bacterium]